MKYFRVIMSVTSKTDDTDERHMEEFIDLAVTTNNLTVTEIDVICRKQDNKKS